MLAVVPAVFLTVWNFVVDECKMAALVVMNVPQLVKLKLETLYHAPNVKVAARDILWMVKHVLIAMDFAPMDVTQFVLKIVLGHVVLIHVIFPVEHLLQVIPKIGI